MFKRLLPQLLSIGRRSVLTVSPTADQVCVRPDHNHRLDVWVAEYDAQQRSWLSPVVEKVSVEYVGKMGEPRLLQMTKGISTPMDCARHLSSLLAEQSAIALVDGQPWNMFRPFTQDCVLDFLQFKDHHHDPTPANEAFWRSAAFLLAATLESAFHQAHQVRLISNPAVRPESGGFVCDVSFTPTESTSSDPWLPKAEELRALSAHGLRIAASNHNFEPLDPSSGLLEMCFADQHIRLKQIRKELSLFHSQETTTTIPTGGVYRMGNFVEVCAGAPLISSSRLIGRFAVSSFLPLGWLVNHTPDTSHPILVYRAQGVALPTAFLTHFTTFDRLIQWSAVPNGEVSAKPEYVVEF